MSVKVKASALTKGELELACAASLATDVVIHTLIDRRHQIEQQLIMSQQKCVAVREEIARLDLVLDAWRRIAEQENLPF